MSFIRRWVGAVVAGAMQAGPAGHAGGSLVVLLEDFPSVSRELAIQVLEDAKTALVLDAHPA